MPFQSPKIIISSASLFLLLAAVFGYIYFSLEDSPGSEVLSDGGDVVQVETPLPSYNGDPIANIGNDPFISQVPSAYVEKYKNRLTELKDSLSNDPSDAEKWLEVGLLKKFFNNYNGARDAWEYAKVVNPQFSTPYYNLGGLYAGYLRDNSKAEENYKNAIAADPNFSYLYFGLADFYTVFYPEKIKEVPKVLLEGLANNPHDQLSFYLPLAKYYASNNNKSETLSYYQKALLADPENEGIKELIKNLSD